jgi:hypothetical protein
MPIPFNCECGKKLQAKDEFAGKRMKCPGCGTVLTIPGPAPASPPGVPAPPAVTLRPAFSAPAAPDTAPETEDQEEESFRTLTAPRLEALTLVRFVCSCGRRVTARAEDIGEEVECPDCGRPLTVPAEDTEEPPPERLPRLDPYAGLSLGQAVTPWASPEARRRGAAPAEARDERAGSWLGTFVVVLLVVGALAAWRFFAPDIATAARKAAPAVKEVEGAFTELDRIPADAPVVISVRPADILSRRLEGRVAANRGPLAELALGATIPDPAQAKRPVLPAAAIERLTLVVLAPVGTQTQGLRTDRWRFFRTTTPYDRQALLKVLPSPKKRTVGDRHYYSTPKGDQAIYFSTPNLFVVADASSMKRFLLREPAPVTSGPLAGTLQAAREGHHLVIGLNQEQFELQPAQPHLDKALLSFQSAQVVVDEPGPARVEVRLTFPQPRAAQAAEAVVRKQRDRMQVALRKVEGELFERVGAPVAGAVLIGHDHLLPALAQLAVLRPEQSLGVQREGLRGGIALLDSHKPERRDATLKIAADVAPADALQAAMFWEPFARLALQGTPSPRASSEADKRSTAPKGKGGKAKAR